jgi:hypothetical protein
VNSKDHWSPREKIPAVHVKGSRLEDHPVKGRQEIPYESILSRNPAFVG